MYKKVAGASIISNPKGQKQAFKTENPYFWRFRLQTLIDITYFTNISAGKLPFFDNTYQY